MSPYDLFRRRERHLARSIEHCISLIALCRVSQSSKAELAYEQRLASATDELRTLRAQQQSLDQTIT